MTIYTARKLFALNCEVIVMSERIEKVYKVSGVQMAPNSPWMQRRGRDNRQAGESFRDMLKKRTGLKPQIVPQDVGEAAAWEGNGATQSLFYENGVDLRFFYQQREGL